jgi:hypothetical protein
MAKAIDASFLICALRGCFVAASGLQPLPNRGVRELPPTCREYAHCSAAGAEGSPFQYELRFANRLESQLLISHLLLLIKQMPPRKKEREIKPLLGNTPAFFDIRSILFQYGTVSHGIGGCLSSTQCWCSVSLGGERP